MPSDQSTWLVAVPHDGEAVGLHHELSSKLYHQCRLPPSDVAELVIPSFKVVRMSSCPVILFIACQIRQGHSTHLSLSLKTCRNWIHRSPQLLQRLWILCVICSTTILPNWASMSLWKSRLLTTISLLTGHGMKADMAFTRA